MKHEHKIISRIAICFSMVLCMLLSTACKRSSEGQDFLGMRVVSAPEGFYVVNNQFSSSPKPATFATASSSFVATLSHEVTWTITIRGVVSGAEKTIVKTSKDINESWDGNSSNIYFFRKGEKAVAELSFMGSGLILKDEIIISSAIVYDNKIVNAVKYTLVDDFDGKGAPLLSISKDAFDTGVIMSADSTQKVQGLYAFKMAGYDASKNGWCGGVNHTNLTDLKMQNKSPQVTNAEELYINMYVYGTGEENSAIEIKIYEVDDKIKFEQINKPGGYVYEQNVNDAWIVQMPITWKGWKLVSKKYSSFTSAKDPSAGGNGNKIKQPNQITGMSVSLLSLPSPGANVSVVVDHVVISEGGVFVP